MKINSCYEEARWQSANGITHRPWFTDLPVNSVNPFYPIDADPSPHNPATPTIYCDFMNTHVRQGLTNIGPTFSSSLMTAPAPLSPAARP